MYWEVFLAVYLWPTIAVSTIAVASYLVRRYIKAIELPHGAIGPDRSRDDQLAQLEGRLAALEVNADDTREIAEAAKAEGEFVMRLLQQKAIPKTE